MTNDYELVYALPLIFIGIAIAIGWSVDNSTTKETYVTFNVKDYGAIGDGITDDTNAIRNTIDEAKLYSESHNNTSVRVYFPKGVYLTRQLVIYSNMYFVGEDMDNTILRRIVNNNHFYFKPYPYSNSTDMNDPSNTFGYPNVSTSISSGHIPLYYRPFIKNYDFMNGNSNLGFINITIDGNGYLFERDTIESGSSNIHNILLQRCNNVYIDKLKSIDSNNFLFQLRMSSNITVKSIYINGNSLNKFGTTEIINSKQVNHTKIYQDGFHAKGVTNLTVDYINVLFSGDDSLAINSDIIANTLHVSSHDVYIKKAVVNSRLANGIRLHTVGSQDIYNITLDEVIINGYQGKYDSNGISIMHWYDDNGIGTPHDITIKNVIVKSLGYIEGDGAFIHIHRGSTITSYSPYNITIENVILNLDGSGSGNSLPLETFRRWAFRFKDLYYANNPVGNSNININSFQLNNMPKGILDIEINNVKGLTLSNGIIKRLTYGGTHISIKDSKSITLNNIQIPLIYINNASSNQGYLGLDIQGTSQYITAIHCVFAVNTKYQYDSTAQQYANTNSLDIT